MRYFNNTLTRVLSISVLALSTNLFALSEEANEGKELFIEANCKQCHGGSVERFDAKNYKAKDITKLQSWISSCDNALEIGWFPEEQTKVLHYLNELHYKYPIK